MRYERLIASRFLQKGKGNFSRPLVNIATWSIALAVLVMVMAVSILRGFQHNIEHKVVGLGSHIAVRSQEVGHYYEEVPILRNRIDSLLIANTNGVKHVQGVAQIGGMVKTDDQIQGIILKGVGPDYDTTFLHSYLVAGTVPTFSSDTTSPPSNEILASQTIANKLGLKVGDKVRAYFWSGDTYRARAFTLVGLYNTDLPELDEHFVIGDLRHVQRINGWKSNEVATWEVALDDFNRLNSIADMLYKNLGYDLNLSTIVEENPALFAWLDLLNSNIVLILAVMAIVCVVAIISALLIMIFEKTRMIGVLKTLGATNGGIKKIFLIKTISLAAKGIVVGSAAALALSFVQSRWHVIRLDSESYSIGYVPVEISPSIYLAIAMGTLLVCLFAMLLPATYISKIEPAKTIRFE
ncbi:MAG: FtsX-like permease family protein [Bacteroidales bacterium]|nr:FtsX-like permease family protein [Bacteroidales bacterium]